jgi:TrpR-related protein YerC/YecD
MEKLHTKDTDQLFEAILTLKTVDECYKFFEDVCTVKEIKEISQRLKAAKMLKNGENYAVVGKETGMSTATISRVNKCLEYGTGGYDMVFERTENN